MPHLLCFGSTFGLYPPKCQFYLLNGTGYVSFPGANEAALNHFILQLHQNGLLKGDELPVLVCFSNFCLGLNHIFILPTHCILGLGNVGGFCGTLLII
uniref:Uncharacterized protein n=1 Tax=Cucumis sativus TaxID=3659 RepID=A0A0A0LFX4_CUCSA